MAAQPSSRLLETLLAPRPLFAGVAAAFLACCLLGRLVSQQNCYSHFRRFHAFINTQTQYFPTPCQLRALGQATLDPKRIAVVVGGNSILLGTGQNAGHVWTDQLQDLLGDRFQVINYGTPAAQPWEFGGLAAEMLATTHPQLVFLTCVACAPPNPRPDGVAVPSFFWNAYYKGLVPPDAERPVRLRALLDKEQSNGTFQDLRWRMILDAAVYADDLWTTTAYCWLNTVWTPHLDTHFYRPRRRYVEATYAPHTVQEMRDDGLRNHDLDIAIKFARSSDPQITLKICHEGFPGAMHERTCVLVVRECPHYAAQLEPNLRARYEAFYPAAVQALRADGFSALDIGDDFTEAEYYDRCHLNESGGGRMAEEVAVEVRALAERLGYLR